MTDILHTSTVHKTASLADEGNSAYCHVLRRHTTLNIYKPIKLALRGPLNTPLALFAGTQRQRGDF